MREMEFGRVKFDYGKKTQLVTLDIELRERKKGLELAIMAGIWNSKLTDCTCAGQCQDTLRELIDEGNFIYTTLDKPTVLKILDIWDRWHLNDLRAGCSHQEENERLIGDIIDDPCGICGYHYGTAWNYESLPEEVVTFIKELIA